MPLGLVSNCAWSKLGEALATLRAYFDESGLHGDATVTGVAGFVANLEAWTELEDRWAELLSRVRNETGKNITEFHAAMCDAGNDEWFGIDRSIRDAYAIGFTNLIAKKDVFHSLGISVSVKEWNALVTTEFKTRFISPYHLCAEQCFAQSLHISNIFYGKTHIELVYAAHEKYSPTLHSVFTIYLNGQFGNSVKSVAFARPSECIPLQAADLVSYEHYRYWKRLQSGDAQALSTDRPQMLKLEGTGHWGASGHYDGRALKILIKRHHSINRLYDPFPEV
jgi:hypothetical protein